MTSYQYTSSTIEVVVFLLFIIGIITYLFFTKTDQKNYEDKNDVDLWK